MKEKDLLYTRCPNCGRFFSNTQENENTFCSDECKIYYKSCEACGNYFSAARTEGAIFCSSECSPILELQDHQ